jgi:hypothetical protein
MDTEAISPRERRSHKTRRSKKLERLAAEDDRLGRGSADDRAFFENNPDREYRARLATPYEVAAFEMRVVAPMPGGLFLWTLIHQLIPGIRMRRYVAAPPPVGPRADIDEATARDLFAAVEEGET